MSFVSALTQRFASACVIFTALASLSGCGGGGGSSPTPSSGWVNISAPGTVMQAGTNYNATGNALVTLTLPSTAATGSVIRVRGVGNGGWQIAQQAGQSMAPPSLWASHATSNVWQGVASSSSGTKLVAVVSGGLIYTSLVTSAPGTTGFVRGAANDEIDLTYEGSGVFQVTSHTGALVVN